MANQGPSLRGESTDRLADAARYALLRRLMPEIEHKLAGMLQPIAMIAVVMERRLANSAPDPQTLTKNVHDLVSLSKEAGAARAELMDWLAPHEPQAVAAVGDVIAQCLKMIATEFSMKGHVLVNEVGELPHPVPRSPVRTAARQAR